jgi:hypothetical protein
MPSAGRWSAASISWLDALIDRSAMIRVMAAQDITAGSEVDLEVAGLRDPTPELNGRFLRLRVGRQSPCRKGRAVTIAAPIEHIFIQAP